MDPLRLPKLGHRDAELIPACHGKCILAVALGLGFRFQGLGFRVQGVLPLPRVWGGGEF